MELGLVGMGGGRRWVGVWRDLAGPHGGGGMRAGTGSFGGNREGRHVGGVGCADNCEARTEMRGQGLSRTLHSPAVLESWEGGCEDSAYCFMTTTTTTITAAVFNRGCLSNAHQVLGSIFDAFQYEYHLIFRGTLGGSDYVILILH